jgi:4-amino-4-deoxy-L-arabinose transferase-like glycosyltransferase
MQHQSIAPASASSYFRLRTAVADLWSSPLAIVLLTALLIVAVNPLGYRGGGADDWHYLSAARCAAEQGFCLPGDHWARRFPLVLPSGAALALFGETRLGLWIVPLIYSVGALSLFVLIVQRQFGRLEATLAGLALVGTPIMIERVLEMTADMTEFALVVAAVFCVQSCHRKGSAGWLAAAGAMLALAIQARPTTLPLVPVFGLGILLVPALRRHLFAFALGFILPIALEALAYAVWAADPMLSWKLSLGHTRIPTSELPRSLDLSQSPLFNIAYIDGWAPAAGIKAHWTVKALINLVVHPAIGLTLTCAVIFSLLNRRKLGSAAVGGWLLPFLAGSAVFLFGALVFGLAIDPKPRMFLAIAAVACVLFGVLAARNWREGSRALAIVCILMMLGRSATAIYYRPDPQAAGAVAAAWIAAEPAGSVSIDELSTQFLTLTPQVRALPVHPAPGAQHMLLLAPLSCEKSIEFLEYHDWRTRKVHRIAAPEPQLIRRLRDRGLFPGEPFVSNLCLLDRTGGAPTR